MIKLKPIKNTNFIPLEKISFFIWVMVCVIILFSTGVRIEQFLMLPLIFFVILMALFPLWFAHVFFLTLYIYFFYRLTHSEKSYSLAVLLSNLVIVILYFFMTNLCKTNFTCYQESEIWSGYLWIRYFIFQQLFLAFPFGYGVSRLLLNQREKLYV